MCLKSEKIYEKDQEFLEDIQTKMGLRSRAMALRILVKIVKKHKLHLDLEDWKK